MCTTVCVHQVSDWVCHFSQLICPRIQSCLRSCILNWAIKCVFCRIGMPARHFSVCVVWHLYKLLAGNSFCTYIAWAVVLHIVLTPIHLPEGLHYSPFQQSPTGMTTNQPLFSRPFSWNYSMPDSRELITLLPSSDVELRHRVVSVIDTGCVQVTGNLW